MNRKIKNILNRAKETGATHFKEVYRGINTEKYHTTPIWHISRIAHNLRETNIENIGIRTSHVFLIKVKPNLQK